MLPWGHLAVGYLTYSLGVRVGSGRRPGGWAAVAVAVGTQLPDLVDKPLAWTLGVIPSGRSLAHSLLFLGVVGVILWRVGRQYDRLREARALLWGHLTHVVADLVPTVLQGHPGALGALLWPITPAYRYPGEGDREIVTFLLTVEWTPFQRFQAVLLVVAVAAWVADGTPGLRWARDRLRGRVRTSR